MEQPHTSEKSRGWRRRCAVCLLLIVGAALCSSTSPVRSESTTTPTPQIDRLATPVVPDNPTPADLGRQVYYLNCMPCHGDVGQGLTDEWRAVWVDDHQNCWAKGCHGGRIEDEGFPLPKTIPAVIGPEVNMGQHATQAELLSYLEQTHPPQRPGKLEKQEYEQVTAFLWHENQRDTPATTVQPVPVVLALGGLLLAGIVLWRLYRARHMRNRHEA
jgi:hypothetical protein